MTTEPGTATAAPLAGSAAASPAAVPEKSKPKFDPRYIAPLFISTVLIISHFAVGVLESPGKTALAILASIVAEVVLGRLFYGKIPHLASAYVTGISVGILVRSPFYWPFALCGFISTASKYVLRAGDRHIWNPSNFGIAVMLILSHDTMSTLTIQFGNSIGPMVVIWVLGSFIISRLKRFHICATYVVSFFLFAGLRAAITGHTYWAEVAPITGPMYQLYTFFMITDPRTTVSSKKGQMLVAFLVAGAECVLRLFQNVHAPYYALFLVGPIANYIEIVMKRKAQGLNVERSKGLKV